ncbi:MAG: helix-turn-helix transcriptional regulator [Alphaproteobacteria bacterium RIFCSPHIGHO2_12_FULL_63_12]|nr:MAG: helix-turn-helix transcriptional regulator [Alphaproteobacteria bacterium RIFCSPHIGHO2_12_FULL_63_12]
MRKTILLYGLALAVAAFALEWLHYKYVARAYAPEIYIFLIAGGFTALGIWAGRRLTARAAPGPFEKNGAALVALGVTDREYEVLTLLAAGCANKEIARRLDLSPNTVKTHLARLYEKLEVQRRTQAVQKARDLALIP